MSSLWIHAFRAGRLERSIPLTDQATVGSRAFCDLALGGTSIDPLHARLVRREGEAVDVVLERSGLVAPLDPATPYQLGDWSLTLEVRPDPSPAARLDQVLALFPRLFAEADGAAPGAALVETLVSVFRADFGALLEIDGASYRVLHRAGKRKADDASIATAVVEQVARGRVSVVAAEVADGPDPRHALALPARVRSCLAAPLPMGQDHPHVVYLESPDLDRFYGEEERALLGRICALAGEQLALAAGTATLRRDNQRWSALHRAGGSAGASLADLVGSGAAMRRVIEQVRQVAQSDAAALILGESGTGKELCAHAIHQLSGRREAPFLEVNCMALPEDLVESELFGHVRGAFSGATADRLGSYEITDGGTLFLDEIGEVSLRVQVKLLRVLEERAIQRLGEGRDRAVDVRLIAAADAPIADAVARGTFSSELFARLNVFTIQLPPLRERLEDLPLLIDHFIRGFNHVFRRRVRGLDPRALDLLARHLWPGNIRELRSVIEAAFVREKSDWITAENLSLVPASPPLRGATTDPEWPDGLEAARTSFERRHMVKMLEAERGSVPATVKRLAVSRSNFYKKCAALGIDPERYRR